MDSYLVLIACFQIEKVILGTCRFISIINTYFVFEHAYIKKYVSFLCPFENFEINYFCHVSMKSDSIRSCKVTVLLIRIFAHLTAFCGKFY